VLTLRPIDETALCALADGEHVAIIGMVEFIASGDARFDGVAPGRPN
jgi:hypothetical protein